MAGPGRRSGPAFLYRAPALGWIAFAAVILWKPIAHSISVLLDRSLPGNAGYMAGAIIGLAGALLVWQGMKKEEHVATVVGFVGGVLIWLGWMEYAFRFFGDYMQVPMLLNPDGTRSVPPNLQVLQSTAIPVLTVLYLILIANRDTRCRAALWIRRSFGMEAGTPSAGYRPAYARITALEVIFVNWFMYLINITLNDSRVFGVGHPAQLVVLGTFVVWSGYLLVFRLPTIREMPLAVRYSIGVAGPVWSAIEIGSRLQFFREIWIYPSQYPITMLLVTATFVAVGVIVYRTPLRSRGAMRPAAGMPGG